MNIISLGERDLYLMRINEEIQNKKRLLVKKKKELDKKKKVNHFLESVKEDYAKYHTYILKEKQQQQYALTLLKEYINDLINTEHLVDEQLRTAKHDQKDIINEIDKVKVELDELVE
jgi:hypothetical protein